MENYRQADSRWGSMPYAGDCMAGSGCGPTAVANITGQNPWTVAQWLTSHGYASNGFGTYWGGISAALTAYGCPGQQLNYSSLYGTYGSTVETNWKQSMTKGGFAGILLMGPGVFTRGGHFITITQYQNGNCYVHDPASAARDGWHSWADFAGAVKIFYLAKIASVPAAAVSTPKPSASSAWKAIGTATATVDALHVRSTPTDATSNNIIVNLYKGNRFEVDGTTTNGWVHIKVANMGIGYVHPSYIRYDGLPVSLSVSTTPSSNQTNTSYAFHAKQITSGSTGTTVLLLQEILKARGIYTGALDRSYGPATTAAVRKYQTLRNMKTDGICGPATWSDLLALPTK